MLYAYVSLRIDVQSGGALNLALVNTAVSRSGAVKISGHDFRTYIVQYPLLKDSSSIVRLRDHPKTLSSAVSTHLSLLHTYYCGRYCCTYTQR